MNFNHLCKNKTFLLILFVILVGGISYGMLYTKDKKIRDKESKTEKIKRCAVPALMLSTVLVGGVYYFKGKQSPDVTLSNEDYFN